MTEQEQSINLLAELKEKIAAIFASWKFKLGVFGVIFVFLAIIFIFWQHILAVTEMKIWASRTGAKPIECMLADSNRDGYVSCTALKGDTVIPLQCGASLFNTGCRVVYGAPPEVVSKIR
jgi:hypothetical protein